MISFRLCSGVRSPTWSRVLAVVAMSLFLTLSVTVCAYAEEGFLGGLQTLVDPDSAQEVENDPVRDYEYEPVLREVETQELEEGTTVGSIGGVLSAVQTIPVNNSNYTPLQYVRYLLYSGSFVDGGKLVVVASGLVFLWWGVRKAKNMIVAAWRGGKTSV